MTGTYERSRAADKRSYEEVMNGDFLFAPREVALRRSPSLSCAHICRNNTVKPLSRPARLAGSPGRCKATEKPKPSASSSFSDANPCLRRSDTLLTTNRQRDLELSTFSVTKRKRVLAQRLCAATLARARHRCGRPKGHASCSRARFAEESRKRDKTWEVMKKL
jgi:hypothetical protein